MAGIKASAGTAAKERGASASRRPVPRRAASPAPAKAAQAASAAKKTAPLVKAAKVAADKSIAKPVEAKAPAKPASPKPAPSKPEVKPIAAQAAAQSTPKVVIAAVQEKPPAPPAPKPTAPPPPATIGDRRPMLPDRLPPRPPAKAEIFVEGDHVVYPTHGVGKVERIATEEIAGHKLELIHITFEENRMTLRVPVAKARSAGLRKLATRKLFDEALAVLKGRARIKRTMWSRRAQEYEAKINSGDPLAIAEVVRDLHRNAGQPDQSFSERQIYEAAMDRLAAELAALDKTDKMTAATKLTNFLKTV